MNIIHTYKPKSGRPSEGTFSATIKSIFEATAEGRIVKGIKLPSKNKLGVDYVLFRPDGSTCEVKKEYDPTLKKRSELRQHLRALRGRDVTQEELESFDPTTIVGLHAQVLVKPFSIGEKKDKKWFFKLVTVLAPSANQTHVADLVTTTPAAMLATAPAVTQAAV